VEDSDWIIIGLDKVGGRESEADDLGVGGFVGPTLVENKIAKRVKDGFLPVYFGGLPNVRVVSVDNVGASID